MGKWSAALPLRTRWNLQQSANILADVFSRCAGESKIQRASQSPIGKSMLEANRWNWCLSAATTAVILAKLPTMRSRIGDLHLHPQYPSTPPIPIHDYTFWSLFDAEPPTKSLKSPGRTPSLAKRCCHRVDGCSHSDSLLLPQMQLLFTL